MLVLHGEPGVGKTALLESAVQHSPEFRIARTSGVEAEMELPFAAAPAAVFFVPRSLGPSTAAPARGAWGRVWTDWRAGAPGAQSILGWIGVPRPAVRGGRGTAVLAVVDDAQWLDQASARALAFVARRLLAEKIALVFAARLLDDSLEGLPSLHVGPLRRRDARALLESVLPAPVDEPVLERIVAETRGNPLALLELPRGLTPTELAGGFGLPASAPVSARIEESFMRRLARLPPDARRLLLVAAADPVGDLALVWRAAERLGVPESTAQMVESEGFLSLSPRVAFWHPLVRSAVYGAAGLDERREVHRALAEATDPASDPDRKAWHRAQAAATPDEEVAAELERSADRAQARGGFAAAAAFLERAVALSPEPSRRAGRALAAAQAKFHAGALDDALELLDTAEASVADDDPIRAYVHLVRAEIAFASRRGHDATPLLLAAARELETIDPSLARATYLEALSASMFAGRLARGAGMVEAGEAALAGPPMPPTASARSSPPGVRRPGDRGLRGWSANPQAGVASLSAGNRAAAGRSPVALVCQLDCAGHVGRCELERALDAAARSSSGARATSPHCRSSSRTGAASMHSSAT